MLKYRVEDMSCDHCVNAITRAVKDAEPGASVAVDLQQHMVNVDNAPDAERVAAAIRDAGYTPVPQS
jgi:copper chaperone